MFLTDLAQQNDILRMFRRPSGRGLHIVPNRPIARCHVSLIGKKEMKMAAEPIMGTEQQNNYRAHDEIRFMLPPHKEA